MLRMGGREGETNVSVDASVQGVTVFDQSVRR